MPRKVMVIIMPRHNTVICPHCGTRQSRRESCISCGGELSVSREEELEILESLTEFEHTRFTRGVRAVSVVTLVTFVAALAILLIRETHNAGPMLMLTLVSAHTTLLTCAPYFSYRYLSGFRRRGRYYYYRRPADADDPYPQSIREVYIVSAILLAAAVVGALAYVYYLDRFRL